jgi:hypothetical protein
MLDLFYNFKVFILSLSDKCSHSWLMESAVTSRGEKRAICNAIVEMIALSVVYRFVIIFCVSAKSHSGSQKN